MTSLLSRPFDLFLFICFLAMFLIAFLLDYLNAVGPANGMTKQDIDEMTKFWPPKPIADFFWSFWMPLDPLLQHNPVWMKVASIYSPFIYGPFYVAALYALVMEKKWIKNFALMWAWGMILILGLIFAETVWGTMPAPQPWVSAGVYGGYVLVPVLVIFRFWSDEVFSTKRQQVANGSSANGIHKKKRN